MSTDIAGIVKIMIGIGVDSAVTTTAGLSVVGIVPPAVPAALQTIKNYLSPTPETPPGPVDEIIDALRVLKEQQPDVYEKLIALFTEKA